MNTRISLGSLRLNNPVLVASGTFGYAEEFKDLVRLDDLGGIVTKTITLRARQGNPPPRIFETPSGLINAIGLENKGLEDFIEKRLPFLKSLKAHIIVSIAAKTPNAYARLADRLNINGVSALELNLSCPNINNKTKLISQSALSTHKVIRAVRKKTKKTIIAKLSPNVTDIVDIAQSAASAGADSVSLVNTFLAMSIDIATRRPRLANITGGLSGPAIKPIALRMVWEVARAIKIPVIGGGGIMDVDDALEFIVAGASAVQVGTANFVNPKAANQINKGIKDYMRKNNIINIKQLIGSIKT